MEAKVERTRISNLKRLTALCEVSNLGFVIIKKPGDKKIELQFGDFGDGNLPIQATPDSIKKLTGVYDYKFIPKKSGLFVLSVECELKDLEECFSFIISKVLLFPVSLNEHFSGETDINDMRLPVEKQFDITIDSVEVDKKDIKAFSFFSN